MKRGNNSRNVEWNSKIIHRTKCSILIDCPTGNNIRDAHGFLQDKRLDTDNRFSKMERIIHQSNYQRNPFKISKLLNF